jgi:hypothetical protein
MIKSYNCYGILLVLKLKIKSVIMEHADSGDLL